MKNLAAKVVLAATVGLAVTTSPAMAADIRYYSASSPLTVWQDGLAQAQMYGVFYVEQASYLRNSTWQRDPRPGGDSVYEETTYYWYEACWSGSPDKGWCAGNVDSGPKSNTSTWYSQYDHDALQPAASDGRMSTHICEDHGIWAKDPCSINAIGTFHY